MKKYLFTICALVVLILMMLLWNRATRPEPLSEGQPDIPKLMATNNRNYNRGNTIVSSNQLPAVTTNAAFLKRDQQLKATVAEKNLPVNFWGRVVDQDGLSLAGVQVVMSLRQWVSEVPFAVNGRFPAFSRETDINGLFNLTDQSGDVLEFKTMKKEGYRLSSKALLAMNYERTSNPPTADNPVIFKMWKIRAGEPLITGSKFFGIIPDGRVYTIDLIKGTKTEGADNGDLQVRINRPNNFQPRDHYGWSVAIEAINGGVIETQDDFMYVAPDSGYQPTFQLNFTPAQEDWTSKPKRNFFIRSRGGRLYGRLEVEIIAVYQGNSVFNINYAVNPKGSRNLEFDPGQAIHQGN